MRRLELKRLVKLATIRTLDDNRFVVNILALQQDLCATHSEWHQCCRAGIRRERKGEEFERIRFQYSTRLLPSESVNSSIISSYTQLQPLQLSLLPCIPAFALEGPDMTIQPGTKALSARSVRSVLPFPANARESERSSSCHSLFSQSVSVV